MEVPKYIRRQLEQIPPLDCGVPACALPTLIEGHVDTAAIATIGINPYGVWSRCDYTPLRKFELDEDGIAKLHEDKYHYFDQYLDEDKYPTYFRSLKEVLRECGASYGEGSAVSMDVIQWPTPPGWNKTSDKTKGFLINQSKDMFTALLRENDKLQLLLSNGRQTKNILENFGAKFDSHRRIQLATDSRRKSCELYKGELEDRRVVGWSLFLSRSRLKGKLMTEFAKRVGELARSGCP